MSHDTFERVDKFSGSARYLGVYSAKQSEALRLKDALEKVTSADWPETLEGIYDAYAAGVYGFMLSYLGSPEDTQDAVHDVFLRILKNEKRWRRMKNPVGYLFKTARNEALSRLRKRAVRERARKALEQGMPIIQPVGSSASHEEAQEINVALGALPENQREVVMLKAYQGMTFQEIGHIVGISPNTAASRYRYALAKLRKLFGDEGSENYGSD